ncbi:MAG TPA: ABC transporter permease [Thermomicrobiales bacterium]|nr:ABC transporter permease [Thermomicrobiales bacterium]
MASETTTSGTLIGDAPRRTRPQQLIIRRFLRSRLAPVAGLLLILISLAAAFAPIVTTHDPNYVNIRARHESPSLSHPLGTDESGRDVYSRLVFGARSSLGVGFIAMTISIVIGTITGGVAGFFGGWTESALMRLTDGMLAIPTFFLVLIVVAVFGTSFINIVLVIGLTSWMVVARVVRGEVLKYKTYDFVTVAKAIGASQLRQLWRHILPHAVPSIIVAASLGVANAILIESALSYLGLGIMPPNPSWGNMLSNAQAYMWENPILPFYPGMLILISVLCFNFLGDALRDALDPQGR